MQSWFRNARCLALSFVAVILLPPRAESVQFLKDHAPAAAARAKALGRLAPETRMQLAIGLPLRNQQGLTAFLQDIYDPSSPNYRQYLSPDQFTEAFGPTAEDYRAVMAFFKAEGFIITTTHPNRMLVDVSATVGQIEKTLHVTLRTYQHPVEARTFFAPDVEPSLDLNVPILHISGLDDFVIPHPASLHVLPADNTQGPKPNSGSGPNGTYMGRDFRAAYAPGVGLTGAGQYVGLLQFDGYNASDVTSYLQGAGFTNVPLINVLLDGAPGTNGPNAVEVTLDIDMAVCMAPALAGVIVYEGAGGFPDDILNRMATDNLAKQLSASWSYNTDATTEQIYQQFQAQGQSFFNASGDSGAYLSTVPTPSDDPNITVVGGTTLSTRGPGAPWLSETTWNWNSTGSGNGASSGGVSTVWSLPTWQQGIDMSTNQGSSSMRNLPDVAMVSDNVFIILNGQSTFLGGDSIASPLWAGFIALANQQAGFSQQPPVGFINPAIYALGKAANYSSVFHDIHTGNNTNNSSPTLYYAWPGYDLCTGWGTPTGKNLINALAPPVNAPLIIPVSSSLALETCNPTNGAINPGEIVIMNCVLQNVGGVNTTNLVATLLSTNGVVPESGPQRYGALVGGGSAVSKQFTFMANGTCGTPVQVVLQLQDGPANLGTVTFTRPTGAPVPVFTENFDGVAAPTLPVNWTTQQINGGTNWVTSTTLRDTPPNAAYAYEPTNPAVSELISPPMPITSPSAQLVFRNNFNTEVDPTSSTSAFDGGVLEIQIGGGSFSDILLAGGSFAGGGYTRTIQTTDNLLNGRSCWAGNSGGFTTTTVNLPPTAAGQTVQFKWRFGTDIENGYGGSGWYIDSVVVKDGYNCCTPNTNADLVIGQSVFPNPGIVGQSLSFSLAVTNQGPGPALNVTVSNTLPSSATFVFASAGYTNYGNTVLWNFGLMPAGRFTNVILLVTPTAEGQATNTAVAGSDMFDPNATNNTASGVVTVYAAPAITIPPTNQVAVAGANVSFSVGASGSAPLSYRWVHGPTTLPGQTTSTLLLTNVQPADSGSYTVVVTNIAGSATSPAATLRVLVPPQISLAGLSSSPTNFSVSINSVTGLNYTLEYKNALTDPTWTAIAGPVIGTGAAVILQDTNGTSLPSRFYRINCN